MPTKKTLPPRVTIDAALNPQSLTVPAMLSRLRCHIPGCNCRFPGGYAHCLCPKHKDRTPSFSITEGPEGIVAECHTRYKIDAANMDCKPEGLQDALAKMLASTVSIKIPEVEPMGAFFDWDAATRHYYRDADRDCIYEVARLGAGEDLEIRARRRDPDGNPIYNLDGVVPVLYRLDLLLLPIAKLIIVCDNERAADAVNEDLQQIRSPLGMGIALSMFGAAIATTTMEGATHLERTDLSPLFGKELVFFPSEDGGQFLYARPLARALHGHATMRVVELPDRGIGGDYTHFRAAGHTMMEALELIRVARYAD